MGPHKENAEKNAILSDQEKLCNQLFYFYGTYCDRARQLSWLVVLQLSIVPVIDFYENHTNHTMRKLH